MKKRFTDADKWRDPWFRGLSVDAKLVFAYVTDNCDAAGVWEPDYQLANFCIHRDIEWEAVKTEFGDRIEILPTGKWYLTRFIRFQYGVLTQNCRAHWHVLALLDTHNIPITYPSPRDKEKEKEEDKDSLKTELQLRIESWFNRRKTTPWGKAEARAWLTNRQAIEATSPEEIGLLEHRYTGPDKSQYCRKDLATLLNNWSGEIDRARDGTNGAQTPAQVTLH